MNELNSHTQPADCALVEANHYIYSRFVNSVKENWEAVECKAISRLSTQEWILTVVKQQSYLCIVQIVEDMV